MEAEDTLRRGLGFRVLEFRVMEGTEKCQGSRFGGYLGLRVRGV